MKLLLEQELLPKLKLEVGQCQKFPGKAYLVFITFYIDKVVSLVIVVLHEIASSWLFIFLSELKNYRKVFFKYN